MRKYNINCVFFSPAFSTAATVNYLAEGLTSLAAGPEPALYDFSAPDYRGGKIVFNRDDLVIFGAPVYSGRLPALAAGRFAECKGDGTPAIVAAVYGNRAYEDALLELLELAETRGFAVIGAAALLARHSMLPEVAAGRPDTADKDQILEFGKKCAWKLVNIDAGPGPEAGLAAGLKVPGNKPYRELPAGPGPRPGGDDKCIRCLACRDNCPVAAIPVEDPRQTLDNCLACARCIAICPVGSRHWPGPVKERLEQLLGPLRQVRHEPEFYL